jgi:3-oxoacyl-[acyl-carrier-protein] synthase III
LLIENNGDICQIITLASQKGILKTVIKAISSYFPQQKLSNRVLCKQFPHLSEKEIIERTGVKNRYIVSSGEIAPDLAFMAAKKLFEEHEIRKDEIDFVILCTLGTDYDGPGSASILQHRLGLSKSCGSLDIKGGCNGYIQGLSIAKGLAETGQSKKILLITAEIPSTVIHSEDYELRMLFGDGATATFIRAEKTKNKGVGDFVFGTDGAGVKNLYVSMSGIREPITEEWMLQNKYSLPHGQLKMNGIEIFIFAIKVVPPLIGQLLEKTRIKMEEVDLFIFHQANAYLLETLRKKMKIPVEKFVISMENYGNTVSSTIPIALADSIKNKKIKPGTRVVLAGFGIGYSWGATLIHF